VEEFLLFVVGQLVEHPDEIVLTKTETPERVTFHIAARKSDVPRIIGKGGHTIQAIRTLLNASAHRRGQKASLEILE
jgi:predicted RNA-binding protein YlqC (UPF0109 family)